MPTYEYGCEACGKTWELEQRITEAPAKDCPSCGKAAAKRLISGGTFLLKGGGWYADGYGSSKGNGKSEAGKSEPSKSEPSKTESSAPAAASSDD
jgi:putative FmdB family regulatory protein